MIVQLTAAMFVGLCMLVGSVPDGSAQEGQSQDETAAKFAALDWKIGPTEAALGTIATIQVPAGHRFLGHGDAGKFMELNENPSDGSELGLLVNTDGTWFVVFEFSQDGYVKDDERDLDVDAILSSIKEGTEAANKLRQERGWPPIEVIGWQQRPFYDAQTNNLTWSIRGSSEGQTNINHSTRLLGRRGVMKVSLVASPEDVGTAVPAFNALLTDFSFSAGQRYSEFTRGDKVAEYGLTGLIVGGAGVALVKTGLLQKFWKLIIVGLVALAGVVKRLVSGLGRGGEASDQRSHV